MQHPHPSLPWLSPSPPTPPALPALHQVCAVPISVADKVIGVLTLGVDVASIDEAKGIL